VKINYSARKKIAPAAPSVVEQILEQPGVRRKFATFKAKQVIYAQGDDCGDVYYIQKGAVRLSLINARARKPWWLFCMTPISSEKAAWPANRNASPRPPQLPRLA
jgi:hypothetical protein